MKKLILFLLVLSVGVTSVASSSKKADIIKPEVIYKNTQIIVKSTDDTIAFGCFMLSCGTVVIVFQTGGGSQLTPDQTATLFEALDHVYCD